VGKRTIRSRGDLDGERECIRTQGGLLLLLRDLLEGNPVTPSPTIGGPVTAPRPTTKGGASAPTRGPTAPGGGSGSGPTFITVGCG
jgi:hypothetical protein